MRFLSRGGPAQFHVAKWDPTLVPLLAIGDILLEWGVNWNKTTYLKAKNVRFESPHVSIVGAGKRH